MLDRTGDGSANHRGATQIGLIPETLLLCLWATVDHIPAAQRRKAMALVALYWEKRKEFVRKQQDARKPSVLGTTVPRERPAGEDTLPTSSADSTGSEVIAIDIDTASTTTAMAAAATGARPATP